DSDQIFERACNPSFLVRFQLGQVNYHIGIDHLLRNEVLVTTGGMGFCQKAWVITCNAERITFIRNRLKKALALQIEKDETFFRLEFFRGHSHTVHKDTGRSAKIPNSHKSQLRFHQIFGPVPEPGCAQEAVKVTSL